MIRGVEEGRGLCLCKFFFKEGSIGFLVGFPRPETRCRIFEIREIPKMGLSVRNVRLMDD